MIFIGSRPGQLSFAHFEKGKGAHTTICGSQHMRCDMKLDPDHGENPSNSDPNQMLIFKSLYLEDY